MKLNKRFELLFFEFQKKYYVFLRKWKGSDRANPYLVVFKIRCLSKHCFLFSFSNYLHERKRRKPSNWSDSLLKVWIICVEHLSSLGLVVQRNVYLCVLEFFYSKKHTLWISEISRQVGMCRLLLYYALSWEL